LDGNYLGNSMNDNLGILTKDFTTMNFILSNKFFKGSTEKRWKLDGNYLGNSMNDNLGILTKDFTTMNFILSNKFFKGSTEKKWKLY